LHGWSRESENKSGVIFTQIGAGEGDKDESLVDWNRLPVPLTPTLVAKIEIESERVGKSSSEKRGTSGQVSTEVVGWNRLPAPLTA
jgi:hypothetical protein